MRMFQAATIPLLFVGLAATAFGQATVLNPLPADQLEILYHLPEGGAAMPLDFYYDLEVIDSITGQPTGQTFPERMAGYGFLEDDQHELPVGFGVVTLDFLNDIQGLSVNCAACHVGEIQFRPSGGDPVRLRILGGPNLADVRRFSQDTYYSMVRALLTPGTLLRLLVKSERLQPETVAALAALPIVEQGRFGYRSDGREADAVFDALALMSAPAPSAPFGGPSAFEPPSLFLDFSTPPSGLFALARRSRLPAFAPQRPAATPTPAVVDLARNASLLFAEANYFLSQGRFPLSTREGYGRLDAFATIRYLLFPDESRNLPFTAPVSVPHLWGTREKKWLHWNNNTNSTLQRNIAQALGMGALAGSGSVHNVLVPNLKPLEDAAESTTAPAWPSEIFGELDAELVARGQVLYAERCAACHDAGKIDRASGLVEFPLFSLSDTGTDPNYALSFHRPVGRTSFAQSLSDRTTSLQNWYFVRLDPRHPIPPATRIAWGGGRARLPALWRDPLSAGLDAPVYAGLPLDGVWATAPYLHNNSVPTLRDLLKPAQDRPTVFRVGHRDYDPQNVGYVQPTDLLGVDPLEVFDTRDAGNSNAGHEGPAFGTDGLTEDDVDALLEYLKAQ
jgi:mono/diheme cytochrome c family protein